MNSLWKKIFFSGILALWGQNGECPSSCHSSGDKVQKKLVFSSVSSSDSDEENISNGSQSLKPSIEASRLVSVDPKPKKVIAKEVFLPSDIPSPKDNKSQKNELTVFFQQHSKLWDFRDPGEKMYITGIFSKSLENLTITERASTIIFLIKCGIPQMLIAKLFQVPKDVIGALKEIIVHPLEYFRKDIDLLKSETHIKKIMNLSPMDYLTLQYLGKKRGIAITEEEEELKPLVLKEKTKEYMEDMPKDSSKEEKKARALLLLEKKIPIAKISDITHMSSFDIKKIAEKNGLSLQQNKYTVEFSNNIMECMEEMSENATKEEKEKRALLFLKNKVLLEEGAKIFHMSHFDILKLAEKNGIILKKK